MQCRQPERDNNPGMRRLVLLFIPLLLVACNPPALNASQDAGLDKVVLINAPLQSAIGDLADDVEAAMRRNAGCCAFAFQFGHPVRFQETHRNMIGQDALVQSAEIARNLGAQVPVMVGTHEVEREVEERSDYVLVRAWVSLQGQVLDLEGNVVAHVITQTRSGSRWQRADLPLPDEREDPLVRELASDGARELAALLLDVLNSHLK